MNQVYLWSHAKLSIAYQIIIPFISFNWLTIYNYEVFCAKAACCVNSVLFTLMYLASAAVTNFTREPEPESESELAVVVVAIEAVVSEVVAVRLTT